MRYAGAAFWLGTALEGEKLILDALEFPPAAKAGFHLGQGTARLEAALFQSETRQSEKASRVKGVKSETPQSETHQKRSTLE